MTAPEVVSGWPDKATVERAAEAIRDADYRYECAESVQMSLVPATYFPTLARAALSVLPDPTADTVLLDQVHACWCYRPGTCAKCGRPEGEHHNNQRRLIRDLQAVMVDAENNPQHAAEHLRRIAALLAGSGE